MNMHLVLIDGKDTKASSFRISSVYQSIRCTSSLRHLVTHATLFSYSPRPDDLPSCVDYVRIPKLSYTQYAEFSLFTLSQYVHSDRVMTIHTDGFPLNYHLWKNEFLDYDYIGAPWPVSVSGDPVNRVGNSGFTIRSREWVRSCSHLSSDYDGENDDVFMCRKYRNEPLLRNLSIAPLMLAYDFSFEHPIEEKPDWGLDKSFGFHGIFHKEEVKRSFGVTIQ